MNSEAFLRHHRLDSNPFRGEEARQDAVFGRVETECRHPDFEKILGDPHRPAAAVVFGERGSGKTALRLQLESSIMQGNRENPGARCMVVDHDEFNPMLGAIGAAIRKDERDAIVSSVTLSDHLDVILARALPVVVDAVLSGKAPTAGPLEGLEDARKAARQAPLASRRELQRLQALYDGGPEAGVRADRLRRVLHLPGRSRTGLMLAGMILLLVLAITWGVLVGAGVVKGQDGMLALPSFILLLGALASGGCWLWNLLRLRSVARAAARRLRSLGRSPEEFLPSLRHLPPRDLRASLPPESRGGDEWRIQRLEGLAEGLRRIGVPGTIILVDRVDEPVAVTGAVARMRSLAWPLFRNKVLQMPGVGMKFLLPLELRDELRRESSDFFQEARLDKQNLVERLVWSGPMLFDLCNARLAACSSEEPAPRLMELFDDSVTRQDVVDALDQMQQPRDAFKMLYGVIQEHCSNVVEEEGAFQVGKTTLDLVRKRQVERKEGMLRGVRPG